MSNKLIHKLNVIRAINILEPLIHSFQVRCCFMTKRCDIQPCKCIICNYIALSLFKENDMYLWECKDINKLQHLFHPIPRNIIGKNKYNLKKNTTIK